MTYLYKEKNKLLLLKNKLKSFFIPNSLKRLSAKNELHDYSLMLKSSNQNLWNLHSQLENIRHDIAVNYHSYDYGNGYYYQSMQELNISGYRDTAERIQKLSLKEKLRGKTVLDIGSNTGFILLSLADSINKGVGVELNPYLVASGKEVQKYIGSTNIELILSSFEDYNPSNITFDAILSLANHSTFDGNTKQSIDHYFLKISSLLNAGGILIFESHPPQIEPKDKLENTLFIIKKYFSIEEQPKIKMHRFLDINRTYIIARKKQ